MGNPMPLNGSPIRQVLLRALGVLKDNLAITALVFCAFFGIALIINVHLANDGVWYWYSMEFLDGRLLYRDLGIALQPLYILINALSIALLGPSWIALRVPALLALMLFLFPIYQLARRSGRSSLEQGILIPFAFFVGIHFEAYRFDDYHVIVHALYLISAVLLLDLQSFRTTRSRSCLAALLGVLCGLAVVTRLNDGILLVAAATLLVFVLAPKRRVVLSVLVLLVSIVTVLFVIASTGDSLSDWIRLSILGAATSKGGGTHLLVSPILLPWNAAKSLASRDGLIVVLQLLTILLAAAGWVKAEGLTWRRKVAARFFLAGLACLIFKLLAPRDPIIVVSAVFVWVACILLLQFARRALGALVRWDFASVLGDERFIALLPIFLWVSGSLSTGGWHFGLYFPFAFFVVLLVVSKPARFEGGSLRVALFALMGVLALYGAIFRYQNPCSWHSYRTSPLFQHRLVVDHKLYGPLVVDGRLYAFISTVCSEIERGGGGELLSLPFPYANYFCGIPPWKGYVQTFFDTSDERKIRGLMNRLEEHPPAWILYQRQLANLELHERTFNFGRPLPHRSLDKLLMTRVSAGQWVVIGRFHHGEGNDWMLVRTK